MSQPKAELMVAFKKLSYPTAGILHPVLKVTFFKERRTFRALRRLAGVSK